MNATASALRPDQAAALLRPEWIETMTAAGYESTRSRHMPDWPEVEPAYREARKLELLRGICAGIAGGFLAINQR